MDNTTNTLNRVSPQALPAKNIYSIKKLHGVKTPSHSIHPKSCKNRNYTKPIATKYGQIQNVRLEAGTSAFCKILRFVSEIRAKHRCRLGSKSIRVKIPKILRRELFENDLSGVIWAIKQFKYYFYGKTLHINYGPSNFIQRLRPERTIKDKPW